LKLRKWTHKRMKVWSAFNWWILILSRSRHLLWRHLVWEMTLISRLASAIRRHNVGLTRMPPQLNHTVKNTWRGDRACLVPHSKPRPVPRCVPRAQFTLRDLRPFCASTWWPKGKATVLISDICKTLEISKLYDFCWLKSVKSISLFVNLFARSLLVNTKNARSILTAWENGNGIKIRVVPVEIR